MACGSEGLCVSEHSSDANADPANIIIIGRNFNHVIKWQSWYLLGPHLPDLRHGRSDTVLVTNEVLQLNSVLRFSYISHKTVLS